MKRLLTIFNSRNWAPEADWARAAQHWAKAGIRRDDIAKILFEAQSDRIAYEHYLRFLTVKESHLARDRAALRTFERTVEEGLPLVRLLKRFDDVAPDLGRRVEDAIDEIGAQLAIGDPSRVTVAGRRLANVRHRPGEPWMKPRVVDLWQLFRGHGYGVAASKAAILEVLVLAGHGDVVTSHKISRIIKHLPKEA